jgi:beta-galactosidase
MVIKKILLPVEVYSACDSVELLLNGTSLGMKPTSRITEFKAKWQVPYQQGALIAKGFVKGEKVAKRELKSAGEPYKIKLTTDRQMIQANKQDLS